MARDLPSRPDANDALDPDAESRIDQTRLGAPSIGRTSRNVLLNLAGQGAPVVAAALSIPLLTRALGPDRFGLMMVAWTLVGFASLFDFGLSRALTHQVAEIIAQGRVQDLPAVVRPALKLITLLGIVCGVGLALLAPYGARHLLKIPANLTDEAVRAAWVMSITIPLITAGAGARGVLEGQHRFALVNAVRVPLGFASFALPVLVLPFTRDVTVLVVMLALCRLVSTVILVGAASQGVPHLWRRELAADVLPRSRAAVEAVRSDGSMMSRFLRVGVWMAVSNLLAPLISSADRFLIGAQLSVAAVGFYAAPQELTTRLLVIPSSLVGAIFPAFTTLGATNSSQLVVLYRRSVKVVLLLLLPFCLVIGAGAHELLSVWLGVEFARQGTVVLQLLAYALLMNGVAHVPFALVQGAGRPDLTAKIHMMEAPIYLVVLLMLLQRFGVAGAAFAFSLRVTVDCFALMVVAERLLDSGDRRQLLREVAAWIGAVVAIAAVTMPASLALRAALLSIVLLAYCYLSLSRWISPAEWQQLRSGVLSRAA